MHWIILFVTNVLWHKIDNGHKYTHKSYYAHISTFHSYRTHSTATAMRYWAKKGKYVAEKAKKRRKKTNMATAYGPMYNTSNHPFRQYWKRTLAIYTKEIRRKFFIFYHRWCKCKIERNSIVFACNGIVRK